MRGTRNITSLLLLVCCHTLIFAAFAGSTFAQTSAAPRKDPLLGRWKSDEAVIDIRANGTILINDQEYVYKVKNSVITVANEEGMMAFPFTLEGDTLLVDVQGREVVYKRLKGNSTGGLTAGASPQSSAGGVLQALVGKWCYMSSLTGSNSYMSSRCFVLYANGRYEYSAESSTSGAYGGTSGQSYDTGRWTATRTTLTGYSDRNGTTVYPIELRNHPKTGDPMIVVDGDAYVTAYQRAPW